LELRLATWYLNGCTIPRGNVLVEKSVEPRNSSVTPKSSW
jgi:hypothetical protein